MAELKLEEFIYQVKHEILDAQKKHEGELAFFDLQDVELEVNVTATHSGTGKINLQVVELGAGIDREHTHSVKMRFTIKRWLPTDTDFPKVQLGNSLIHQPPEDPDWEQA